MRILNFSCGRCLILNESTALNMVNAMCAISEACISLGMGRPETTM